MRPGDESRSWPGEATSWGAQWPEVSLRGVAWGVVLVVVDGSADEDGAGSVSDGDVEGVLDIVGVGVCGAGSDAVAGAVDGAVLGDDEPLLG